MEALSDMGATVVVSPSSDDRVDRLDQFAQTQRYTPLSQGPDLILESVHRLLCGNGIEILPVQFGFDPVVGQFKLSFPTLDFESEKLEALRNVHNPGRFPSKASDRSLPSRLLRLLPAGATLAGRDLHPLKNRAFPRHTPTSSSI